MTGSCALFFGSNIGFDPCLEFLPRTERDDAACADRNLFSRLRITPGALVLVAQVEVSEAGELHLLSARQRSTNLLEEKIHELARLALVEPELIEQRFRHLRFGQGHFFYSLILAFKFSRKSITTETMRRSTSSSVRVREIS